MCIAKAKPEFRQGRAKHPATPTVVPGSEKNISLRQTAAIAILICSFGSSWGCHAETASDSFPDPPRRASVNLHLFGLSYHPDRQGIREKQVDNELNYGLGVSVGLVSDSEWETSLDAGFYKDSGSRWARFTGLVYQFRLSQRWRIGIDALLVQSPTYNQGNILFAPIPHLTVDLGQVKANAIFIPKFEQYNVFAVLAFYLTIPLKTW